MADNQKGQGFANVASGISGLFTSLFGSNGAADELGVAFGRKPGVEYDSNIFTNPQKPQTDKSNNTMFIILLLVGVAVMFFILKK